MLAPGISETPESLQEGDKQDDDEESTLVKKIKSKDELIKEIDAQISRLDALDDSAPKK